MSNQMHDAVETLVTTFLNVMFNTTMQINVTPSTKSLLKTVIVGYLAIFYEYIVACIKLLEFLINNGIFLIVFCVCVFLMIYIIGCSCEIISQLTSIKSKLVDIEDSVDMVENDIDKIKNKMNI